MFTFGAITIASAAKAFGAICLAGSLAGLCAFFR